MVPDKRHAAVQGFAYGCRAGGGGGCHTGRMQVVGRKGAAAMPRSLLQPRGEQSQAGKAQSAKRGHEAADVESFWK